ncbi:MAG: methyltransferase [Jannaschia sp.]
MSDAPKLPGALWSPRSPQETVRLYDDWAASYDTDMDGSGYVGPARCARIAARVAAGATAHDLGCGTGLAGIALRQEGFETIDGSDVSDAMLVKARARNLYRSLTLSDPATPPVIAADATLVVACGVISFGAGPASLLVETLKRLPDGGWLVFTYNDTTLRDADYMGALADVQANGLARLELAEYGPQLPAQGRGCTVHALRRL